ncbi:MAG TPA: Ppx/GppA phosphatase family protein [Caulobacteraceae bacterium]
MSASADSRPGCDAAVIDVGSNSVRLVLYRVEGRSIWTVFNEKVLAGLGRGLAVSGRLSPGGVEVAIKALQRFRALLDASRPELTFSVATAAVREASDGRAFCKRVAAETGLELRILTGQQEARLAALGVLAGAPSSRGVVGDLGGSSLELVRLSTHGPGPGVSLPLGPFALGEFGKFDPARVRSAVARHLAPLAATFRTDTLHAVGGAWRNIALLHMRMSSYPLGIVHQYEMSRREALEAARFVGQQSRASLERIEGISRRRVEALPHASIVLQCLVESLNLERVVVSAYGLREGLLFEAMSPTVQARDPLVEGCAALGFREAISEGLGGALEAWLRPAFSTLDPLFEGRDATLLAAACRLADLGSRLHPDHRADLVFDQVLRAPIAGMDHRERVFLACAAFARHTAASDIRAPHLVFRLLSGERYQRARALGTAIRLACDISGRSPQLLSRASLEFRPGAVVLRAAPERSDALLGELAAKRGATLATILERELKIRPSPGKAPRPERLAAG